jgi:hypothetical protein
VKGIYLAVTVLAAALGIVAVSATPRQIDTRAAVTAAQSDYIAARDKARIDFTAAKAVCGKLDIGQRDACLKQARSLRHDAFVEAQGNYEVALARATASNGS